MFVYLRRDFTETVETNKHKQLENKLLTKSAKVAFSPGVKLSIISHSSTVSVASRHTNNNLTEKKYLRKYVKGHKNTHKQNENFPSIFFPEEAEFHSRLLC